MTLGGKTERVLWLLMGLRDPKIAATLMAYGFDKDALDEGWKLLRAATGARLDVLPKRPITPTLIQALDDSENKWFPIIRAVLDRHYPAISEKVFLNLAQTEGLEVAVVMQTLIGRVKDLPNTEGATGKKALELITARGFDKDEMKRIEGMLVELASIAETDPAAEADVARQQEEAEKAMWGWYLEWSTIARSAIRNRRQLRSLGFLRPGRSSNADEPNDEIIDPVEDQPTPPPPDEGPTPPIP